MSEITSIIFKLCATEATDYLLPSQSSKKNILIFHLSSQKPFFFDKDSQDNDTNTFTLNYISQTGRFKCLKSQRNLRPAWTATSTHPISLISLCKIFIFLKILLTFFLLPLI